MTHEFKKIVDVFIASRDKNLKTVLATVVHLEGSSYRRPGVRMLFVENGKSVGAVSGGCVEKEIQKQAETVFKTQMPKMMTYDGRYRLGCEGLLYILIEPFCLENDIIIKLNECYKSRTHFDILSCYNTDIDCTSNIGSWLKINNDKFPVSSRPLNFDQIQNKELGVFKQQMKPCFKLIIFGTEHDAVQLCNYASLTGWEVTIVAEPLSFTSISCFPGATDFQTFFSETFNCTIDNQTAVVLMSHSYANDLKYLLTLKNSKPIYMGLLGPAKRRDKLLNQFIESNLDTENETVLDVVYGPTGLNIGAETPQEIAVSIIAEILSVVRKQKPVSLSEKMGSIHE
ncbi:XdhC family protein [Formosa sp. PL04]|uniref:XdhC family protein n=1 Tax=Formosa sp. PL04 TaxID=3081755 RepID=UPI0029813740|nr:XdhC family protein [Formosa sp. PL04]MDW5288076.1 XdhC family protein [Formosa sp. PL04]